MPSTRSSVRNRSPAPVNLRVVQIFSVVRVAKAILAAGAVALVTWVAATGRFVMIFAYLSLASAYLHRPLRYEIDEGFRGWARVTFGQPNCRSLESDGFSLVIHINEKGQSCTSDRSPLSAWRRTSYFYIARDGTKKRTLSVGHGLAEGMHQPDAEYPYEAEDLFVGTAKEFREAGSQEPRQRYTVSQSGQRQSKVLDLTA